MPPVNKKTKIRKLNKASNVDHIKIESSASTESKQVKNNQINMRNRGVVFIKHLPHGFFEEQLKKYFEQFGEVTRLRLSRSKRTGGSKGYAFIEFAYPEVAQVAAETMNNYLMFKKVIKTAYIPPEQQRFNYFKSSLRLVKNKAGKKIYVSSTTAATQRKVNEYNDWTDDAYQKRTLSASAKLEKIKKKYSHLGIDFSNIVLQSNEAIDKNGNTETAPNATNEAVNNVPTGSKNKTKKSNKKNIKLEKPLCNTVNEELDVDDEGVENDNDTTDEESYGFTKGGLDSEDDDDDDSENEDIIKTNRAKPKRSNKVQLEHIMKRKPQTGGIIKQKKVAGNKHAISGVKRNLIMKAVKESAKPLSTFKKNIKKRK